MPVLLKTLLLFLATATVSCHTAAFYEEVYEVYEVEKDVLEQFEQYKILAVATVASPRLLAKHKSEGMAEEYLVDTTRKVQLGMPTDDPDTVWINVPVFSELGDNGVFVAVLIDTLRMSVIKMTVVAYTGISQQLDGGHLQSAAQFRSHGCRSGFPLDGIAR